MNYTTLLFDADGTLYDFKKTEEISLENFYKKVKPPCSYDDFTTVYERENKLLWQALERGEVTAEEVKVNRFINTMKSLNCYEGNGKELSTLFIDELAKCDFLLEGAEKLIEKLAPYYKLYIITNGLWDVQRRRIGKSDLYTKHFEGLIVSEKVGAAKPSSIIFDSAFETAGNPSKEDVLMIGDSLTSDVKGGNIYGIDSCWFNLNDVINETDVKPTYTVKFFSELEDLLLES